MTRNKKTPIPGAGGQPVVQHPPAQQPQLRPQGRGGLVGGRSAQSAGGPSRPPTPKLNQASQPSHQGAEAPSRVIQPDSIMSVRRPGSGSLGFNCIVKANHFTVELPTKHLYYQYDVSITPETRSPCVNRAVIQQLVKNKKSDLMNMLPFYDGRKSLYTAGALPFRFKKFKITLTHEDDGARDFEVAIAFVAHSKLDHLKKLGADPPQEVIKFLDIVLRELVKSSRPSYCPVGRSFYSPDLGGRQALGDGLESWLGFYQRIRPTQMGLSLNLNMSSTAFIEPIPVIDFVKHLLKREGVLDREFSDSDHVKVEKALKGVKVEVTHRENMQRKYCIFGLTTQPTRELTFSTESRTYSVAEYFLDKYEYEIKHTNLPCLQVGNPQRPNYLPIEVCRIVEGHRYSKRLNEEQITALLKVTCRPPKEREADILQTVKNNAYADFQLAKEFEIKINNKLASVNARVLSPPRLQFHGDDSVSKYCIPKVGQWNMIKKTMFNGGKVNNWLCINFEKNISERTADHFCHNIARTCVRFGMEFNYYPVKPVQLRSPNHVETALRELKTSLKSDQVLDLLVVLLPNNNGPLYGELKRICETELGIVSQCCLRKHVCLSRENYFANVALKINVKVGGRNTVLSDAIDRRIPLITDMHTMIFGAVVTHPHPGEDSSPSIAAVVASKDWPEITQYAASVCAQAHRQERIEDLYKTWQDPDKGTTMHGGMIRELLMLFNKETGKLPLRIIFYRNGVHEGQFYQLLRLELKAIRQACLSLQSDYNPKVTFVVVQKRHNTRLFGNNSSGDIFPGTVVDSKICHPTEFDFYLCSHARIQGTSRPAHYHVVCDENNFTANQLQKFTNDLCYTYARCTRSVSIVPPVYYAHLAASRARFYMKPDTSDHTAGVSDATVRPLPQPTENVKRVMFYC